MLKIIYRLLMDRVGNIAISAAILAVPLLTVTGVAVDYAVLYNKKSGLQQSVDAAALAGAKEMGLSNASAEAIQAVVGNYVHANSGGREKSANSQVNVKVSDDGREMTVYLSHHWEPFLLHLMGDNVLPIKVTATVKTAGTGTVCMIGLDREKKDTIHLTKKARLEAPGCGVYSNSNNKDAIKVEDNATLVTGLTCSVGGFKGARKASFLPEPIVDCPPIDDPLSERPAPLIGSCDHNKFEVRSGFHRLYPGTYCNGLKVKGTAEAFLMPGVYVINGDKLEVTDTAIFEGENVGFYLSGSRAKLSFKKQTTISLTAPNQGIMAGILIYEDRNAVKIEKHEITSDNARLLLGTIYLPNGTLRLDSDAPIADQSAYTAIIARTIELDEGPT